MRLLSDKLLLTKYKGHILTARKADNEIVEMNFEPEGSGTIVGNIYVGRVENVVKNINAAFVSYEKGMTAYLPLEDKVLHQGDLIVIQIVNEAIKTKPPKASMDFSLTGRYAVVTHGKPGLGISSKITDKRLREELKARFESFTLEECGIVIRTNAADASVEEIEAELEALLAKYETIIKYAGMRSAHTLLHEEEKAYVTALRSINFNEVSQIVTDDKAVFEDVEAYIKVYDKKVLDKLVYMYEEQSVLKLHGLESVIKQALSERVWLKCGGYLVIQPTEALTVIDVNSGKCVLKKKTLKETIKKVNLEACEMIAKQLRLRNLSGIIIVDFIDMEDENDREELLKTLKTYIETDLVKTLLIDMTKLNLVEITRQKIKKPVYEQLKDSGYAGN